MSMATIKLGNPARDIFDDEPWEEGAEVTIETGYDQIGLTRRHGKFYLSQPSAHFGENEGLTLVAFGEEIKLGRTEKRRVFQKKTDSQIAKEIAGEYGFGTDVEETSLSHEQVIQANETDYQFLHRRAQLYGYQMFLQDGKFHFHKPRPDDSQVRIISGSDNSNLLFVAIQSKPFLRGAEFQVTQVDPLKLELIDEKSKDDEDPVTSALKNKVRSPRLWNSIAAGDVGERPIRFMVNQGHEQQLSPLKDQAQSMSEASRWLVGGRGRTVGLDTLRPNQLVDLVGIGKKYSGKYYLTKVIHRLRGGVYDVEFEVARSFLGGSKGNMCSSSPSESKRAGVATL